MVEIFHIFFFVRISQSLEVILIPACRFLLESSEPTYHSAVVT